MSFCSDAFWILEIGIWNFDFEKRTCNFGSFGQRTRATKKSKNLVNEHAALKV